MLPLFPTLNPLPVDTAWFNVDKPVDDERELRKMERKVTKWRNGIKNWYSDQVPIGLPLSSAFDKSDDSVDEARVNNEGNANNAGEDEDFIEVVEFDDREDNDDDDDEDEDDDDESDEENITDEGEPMERD